MQISAGSHNSEAREPFSPRNVALLLAGILLVAYFPILLGGQTLCYRDFGVMGIPTASYHRAAIRSGELPLWNPYSNCGVPFLAQWGTMVLYPLSLLYVFLPMPWSLNFFCILHLWIGGMGMYYLARRWVGERWPAALAAIAFLSNGITQATLTWPNYAAAVGLLPWVIITVESVWEQRAEKVNRRAAAAALVAALQLLTGVPEIAIFTWILVIALLLPRLFPMSGERTSCLGRTLLIVVGAAGLCAAQLIPFLQLLHYSHRAPGFAGNKWALPIWGWADFLLPRFHTFTTPEGTVFQYGQEFLSSIYLGGGLLILASLCPLRRNGRAITLTVVSIFAAVLAFGSNGYVYPLLLRVLPPLGLARYPVKFLFLLGFTVPLLAAYGARSLSEANPKTLSKALIFRLLIVLMIGGALIWINLRYPFSYDRVHDIIRNSTMRIVVFTGIGGLLFALCKSSHRASNLLRYSLIMLLTVDGFTHIPKQNPTISSQLFQPDLWAQSVNLERPEIGTGRVFISPEAEARLLHSSVADVAQDTTGKRLALWSHLNLLDHVPKVNGSATLQLRDEALVQNYLYANTNLATERWLDFLNVTLRTATNSVIDWQSRPHPMPFITGGQKPMQASANVLNGSINFGAQVALEPWSADFNRINATAVSFSDIEVSAERISFTAKTQNPAAIIVPQSWHPAWVAQISNADTPSKRVPVLKANLAFQAILIPAGEWKVVLWYRDIAFWAGATISLLTIVGGMIFAHKC